MTERLLRRTEVAAMLGTGEGVAATELAKLGVHPIDFGRGRGRGPRWLESSVRQAMQQMYVAAQPKQSSPHIKPRKMSCSLASMSNAEIFNLTSAAPVQ